MACVIADTFSSWRLATITQNITLNKSAMCTDLFKMQINIYCFKIWDYATRFKKEY